ncbi:Rv1157c family protein [Mycolicibacterium brumae]|uniref:Uncharacterized protein n=1 Tax=Mycolicibacterium brumae TaxID=85968 RepID=A0A2G5PFM4_9MYCO|nr:hypothetical protein [Mycolicibacterium brumae]MCV7192054.1 hypothetical protein [Mycolicibacterium brumae]PIB76744.1 hypothetical protein CQY22_003590 [Mycolicibacterium brumae]RWA20721.1 hypothetical protein MBRU_03415 [Mycolicibacterium brumae DSM 44177]UWW07819.1 hypothetical protein L2Z93_000852 [Mycolicibacterium brumae]
MSRTRNLLATTAAVIGSSMALVTAGVSHADPTAPPVSSEQAPGLPAMQNLSPIIQQAAADPSGAASLLMSAAQVFIANSKAPEQSNNVANAVMNVAAEPVQPVAHLGAPGAPGPQAIPHVIPEGMVAGSESHLPPGIDPANAVGPVEEAPAEAPAEPLAAPEVVPAAVATPDGQPAPPADFPTTQDFMYPSFGNACLADGGSPMGLALSVAGPATLPPPGPGPGQIGYVFTAMGAPKLAEHQKLPLNVTWVNLSTGKSGSLTLQGNPEVNPDGPATLTGVADTGAGSIITTIFGGVTTVDGQCQFQPTIGSAVVP